MLRYLVEIEKIVDSYRKTFPEDDEFLHYLPKQLSKRDLHICHRKNFSGHLTASALLIDERQQAAFLIYHKFLDRWLQPGGHLDPEEEPSAAAKREFLEETGVNNIVLHRWHQQSHIPLDIDSHFIPNNPAKLEFSHYHHDFLYVFVSDGTAPVSGTLQEEEVTASGWFSLDALVGEECGKRLARAIRKFKLLA